MNKYTLTSFLFLLTIYSIGSNTVYQNIVNYEQDDGELIEVVNEMYDNHLAFSGDFIDLWSRLQVENPLSKITLLDDAEYGSLIKDDKGNLYFPFQKADVTKYIERTTQFSKSLRAHQMNYIYVQAPNKMIKGYTNKGVYQYNYSNQCADEFLKGLKRNKVDYYDLRDKMKKSGIANEKMFYKTDHHWTTETAFWTFQTLVDLMQTKYGIEIDAEHFYTNLDNYRMIKKENSFLGSLGRRVGESIAGVDSYTYIYPYFETDYTVYNGVFSLEEPIRTGTFSEAITCQRLLASRDINDNKHAVYYEMDYRIFENSK